MHLSLLIECFVLTKVIRVHNLDKPWFNGDCTGGSSRRLIFGGVAIALELTGMSLFITRGGLMKFMPRLGVSLVSEAGICSDEWPVSS